jgi:nucleoid-associated protein EbfC
VNPLQLKEMLASAQTMREQVEQKMQETRVEASSGGGAVTAQVNGQKQLLSLTIAPSAMSGGDVEMLQDLILAAVNEAGRKADDAMKNNVSGMFSGFNLPGLG